MINFFQRLGNLSKKPDQSLELFKTVQTANPNLSIGNYVDFITASQFYPCRTAHLGESWKLLAEQYHLGSGVFHDSIYNVSPDGSNLLLLDQNTIPGRILSNLDVITKATGDILWWPGYKLSSDKLVRDNLYVFNSKSRKLKRVITAANLYHPHCFVKKNQLLNHYYIEQVKNSGKEQAEFYSFFYFRHRKQITRWIKHIMKEGILTGKIPLKYIVRNVVNEEGKVEKARFQRRKNIIKTKQYEWTADEFCETLTLSLFFAAFSEIDQYKSHIEKLYGSRKVYPLLTKELKLLFVYILKTKKIGDFHIHFHSGGYQMGGVPPLKKGYIHESFRISKKIFRILTTLEEFEGKKIRVYMFPAAIFAIGSYTVGDLTVLNKIINEFQKLSNIKLNYGRPQRKVFELFKKYEVSLSDCFRYNFTSSIDPYKLQKCRGRFEHPRELFNLSIVEASLLVGHFKEFYAHHESN